MQDVSARFLAGLAGVPRWARTVEWSADGVTWAPVTLHAGKVTQDATSQVRWSLDAEISGVTVGPGGLSPFGPLLRVKVGMVHSPADIEWVPLGVFRCEKAKRSLHGATVTVSGASLEASVIDAQYPAPRIIPAGLSSVIVTGQIREVIPSASISWLVDDPAQPRLTTTTSRWGVIDGATGDPSIARALGAQMFCDRSGTFVMDTVPTLYDDPVWTVDEGPGGVLVQAAEELSREGLFNVVAVTGESEDSSSPPVGPGIASDDVPGSPTFADADPGRGGFGQVVFHYSSPLLKTLAACQAAARSMLAPRLGLHQQIDWNAAVNPALDVGDVVLVRNPSGLTPTILDSLDLDLVTMTQTGKCRATSTRLEGGSTLAPSQQGT
ncbi:MAG: DUF5047 domain-containing protein [Mycobacteriaceae bacterium]